MGSPPCIKQLTVICEQTVYWKEFIWARLLKVSQVLWIFRFFTFTQCRRLKKLLFLRKFIVTEEKTIGYSKKSTILAVNSENANPELIKKTSSVFISEKIPVLTFITVNIFNGRCISKPPITNFLMIIK